MFERYTEKARRTIFFARYEASQFGSPYIETEHLLLGLLKVDKALANLFFRSHAAIESIHKQIEAYTTIGEKMSTSVDLPLSRECVEVLTFATMEAERLSDAHIGTPHLVLGMLCEEKCFAAQLLRERGLTLASVREQIQHSEITPMPGDSAFIARLDRWLAEHETRGGIGIVKHRDLANSTTHFAIYAGDQPEESDRALDKAGPDKLAQIQKRIDFITQQLERAIADHEFKKAHLYSEEERKERESLRLLCEQFNLEEPPPRVPLLCIEIVGDERFSEVQTRCDNYIAGGVAQVWLLKADLKRAYTVTKAEGFRELKGEILKIANPPLELDLKRIFD